MKKSIYLVIVLLFLALISFIYYFSQNDIGSFRLNLNISKITTEDYVGLAPNISFKYPDTFTIDNNLNNKYGNSYIAGIKLNTDSRTGCDIRINGPKLNYNDSINSLTKQTTEQISQNAKEFKLINQEKIKIDGRDGFNVTFSFKDPLGSRIQLQQVFVTNNNINYIIICGTGEQQYPYFRKDFNKFFKSINFDVNETDFINNQ